MGKYKPLLLYNGILSCEDAVFSDLGTYGNRFYNICKSLPGLAIASNLVAHEKICTLRYPEAMNIKVGEFLESKLVNYFQRIPKCIKGSHMLLELSGLWKAYGFPIIDVEKSAGSLIDSCSGAPVTASNVPRVKKPLC